MINHVENIWQFMRDNWLSNRVFKSYDDMPFVLACARCAASPTRTARRSSPRGRGAPFATVVDLWRRSNACLIWTTAKKKRMVGLLSGGRD